MKKSLLIVFAAVLALSASAQRKVSFQKANIDGLKVTMSESGILTGMKSVQAARQHSFSVSNARKAAVASVDDVLGCYIFEDFEDQEQTIPQDLVLKMTKTEGENKVYIANFAGYKGGITGTLNAEEGYIDFGGGYTRAITRTFTMMLHLPSTTTVHLFLTRAEFTFTSMAALTMDRVQAISQIW